MIKKHIHRMAKTVLRNVTIHDVLETINKDYGDITALQMKGADGGWRKLSYVELGKRAVDVSSTLIKLGIQKSDRVAIYSESRPEWPVAFFGIISCAGIVVPIDVKLSEKEVQFILNNSRAKIIFVSEKYIDIVDKLKDVLPYLSNVILLDDSDRKDIILLKDLKMKGGEEKYNPIYPEDTALIVYTSGTTGVAKGVELIYKNLLFQILALSDVVHYKKGDQFLSILPLNHMLEITGGLIAPLYAGACVTYCDSLKPTVLLSLMRETRTTTMICVPLVLKMLHDGIMKKIDNLPKFKHNISMIMFNVSKFLLKFNIRIGNILFYSVHQQFGGCLRNFVSGGAPLDPAVELNFNAMGFRILQGYGLTETSPVITVNTFTENKYGSVGKPLPGAEVKILVNSETGGREGEIITRGPHVMKGYFGNPEKTNEVLRDGWFYTGDIGYFDDDGYLFISGRIKNLIVLGAGKKVFPEEIEEVMSGSRYIKEICVLGRIAQKGARKGCEEVYAVIVPNLDMFDGGDRRNIEFIREKINSEITRLAVNLASYKRIVDFEIWNDDLPKTATRKVKRKALLDFIARKDAQGETKKEAFVETAEIIEDDITLRLRRIVSEVAKIPEEKVKVNTNLYNEAGIDSLMKVEILAAVDKELGIAIPDRLSYEINSFADLVKFTKEYKAGRSDDEAGLQDEINNFIKINTRFRLTHNAAYFILKTLFKIYFKKSVFGLENIPREGSFIIAANHSSLLDFPLIMTSLPFKKMKDIFAPAAKDYFYSKKYRKAMVEILFNTFPFERMGDFMKGLKTCESLIKNGRSIILFPEGTRGKDGTLQPFKPGLGSLALNLNVPIVPVYIKGASITLPKGKVLPSTGKISIQFGKAIHPEQLNLSNIRNRYEKYVYISNAAFNEIKNLQ